MMKTRSQPRHRPAPPPPDQAEQRRRRRARLTVVYDGAFNLSTEIEDICTPLAKRIASGANPNAFAGLVDDLSDAVAGLVSIAVGWCTEADAMRRCAHLSGYDKERGVRTLCDLAKRPKVPAITDASLETGRWAGRLARMADPYTDSLAALLAWSYPPDHPTLRGAPSRSERLEAALREVDAAALAVQRRLDWIDSQPPPRPRPERDPLAELAKLGVSAP